MFSSTIFMDGDIVNKYWIFSFVAEQCECDDGCSLMRNTKKIDKELII